MDDIRVCRICLRTDTKMFDLQSYPLETYFEPLIGVNLLSTMDLPPFLCFECVALVKKFYMFRGRCLRGQASLYGLLNTFGKITIHNVKQVDRLSIQLHSNLSINHIPEASIINHVYDPDLHNVKEEPTNNDDDDIKSESGILHFMFNNDDFIASSDDNEPLSLHKSNKEKERKKKKKGQKSKKTDVLDGADGEFEVKRELEIEVPSDLTDVKVVQTKRKRGRPPKAKADLAADEKTNGQKKRDLAVIKDDIDLSECVVFVEMTVEQQIQEINERKNSSNYLNSPYQCDVCYKGFIEAATWKHHIAKHDPSSGDIECEICRCRFKTRRKLQRHAANHGRKFACRSCPYVSRTVTQAKQHQRWHKGVTYKCQYCDEVSSKWTSHLSHVRMKHPSDHVCDVCGYSFVSRLGLAMHRTMMHKDAPEKLKSEGPPEEGDGLHCAECDVTFESDEAYKRHRITSTKHQQDMHFGNGCRECGEMFLTAEELRVHHRAAHAPRRPRNYGKKRAKPWPSHCEHCSEPIASARDYWTHYRRAHPDKSYPISKNYICDICGKGFRGNAFLVYHKRTHSDSRQYKCGQCGKAFFNRANLNMHEKTHSDSRPYPCSVCFKAFKCKGALDRHFRSHTGEKPYECEVCGKAFGQSNSRKLHVRTVHLKQPAPYISRSRLERRSRAQLDKDPVRPHFVY